MGFGHMARMGAVAVLATGLAGCMDVSMDIAILSESEARSTVTTTMSSDIYAMISAQAQDGEDFCEDGEIVEEESLVSCVVTDEGSFADLAATTEEESMTIESIGNGRVRVAFPTGELAESLAEQAGGDDPQIEAMIAAMFEGHAIVLSVSGGPILETNMVVGADGVSADYEIPFSLLLGGTADLPEEIFAVVQK